MRGVLVTCLVGFKGHQETRLDSPLATRVEVFNNVHLMHMCAYQLVKHYTMSRVPALHCVASNKLVYQDNDRLADLGFWYIRCLLDSLFML
jgi:hypothetical protein